MPVYFDERNPSVKHPAEGVTTVNILIVVLILASRVYADLTHARTKQNKKP